MNKSPIHDPIAKEELVWARKDGTEIRVIAQVGRPYKIDEDDWACPAELIGIDSQYPDIHGSSSMHALCLAIQLIKSRIGHLLEDGEALYDLNDRKWKWEKKHLEVTFGK